MKTRLLTTATTAALLCAGCFENREAPRRPVTAHSLAEAVTHQAAVERVILAGQTLPAFPRELAAMPRLAVLELRGTKASARWRGLPN